ncbi:MAG: SWIM zinc finger family protein [Myxococcota bacterium]|nr:SWIM zinc finger family protein [Myxococcota bacterium]
MSEPLKLARVEAAAPDQASLTAARKLLRKDKWPALHVSADGALIWGECQGSGSSPYRMAVELQDLGAKCSCPSRKFPCKHSLALMWWRAEEPGHFSEAALPEWVDDWQSRRRRGPGGASGGEGDPGAAKKEAGPTPSVAATARSEAPKAPKDPALAAAQRARNKARREQSIARGLDELDRWIADQLDRGLAAFGGAAAEQCQIASQRLADAKATGLATWLEGLPGLYFSTPEPERHDLLLEQLGGLHLLAEAYRRQDALPEALRSDVRRIVGWSTTRAELLQDAQALRLPGEWIVLAARTRALPQKLVRCETWLVARAPDVAPRFALLLDFVPPAGAGGWLPLAPPGHAIQAELVFQPSATPLIALVGEQSGSGTPAPLPATLPPLTEALAGYDAALAANPWLPAWPLAAGPLRVQRDRAGALWADDADALALPLHEEAEVEASTLLRVGEVQLFGLFDGRRLWPLAAQTPIGPWWMEASGGAGP